MFQIVGMMFCRNEADIIEETITDAVSKVDQLYISDDGSTDNSWEIIKSCQKKLPNITHIQQEPNKRDVGQRSSMLKKIQKRFRSEDTWVQIIEADIFLLTDPKEAIKYAVKDVAVTWKAINAVRARGTWKEVDTYPNWNTSIKEIMNLAHEMEAMLYTFRPLPKLFYHEIWRPWPAGFSHYALGTIKQQRKDCIPVLLHCGYRGPNHFYQKYKKMGKFHKKYPDWNISSPEEIEKTVAHFTKYPDESRPWKDWIK